MRTDTATRPDIPHPAGPAVLAQAVQSSIDAATGGTAAGERVRIHIRGADVTLTGPVYSWQERTQVRLSASQACGVRSVVDMMTVRPWGTDAGSTRQSQ
jgi:osmotically-inducible protein OsmY